MCHTGLSLFRLQRLDYFLKSRFVVEHRVDARACQQSYFDLMVERDVADAFVQLGAKLDLLEWGFVFALVIFQRFHLLRKGIAL